VTSNARAVNAKAWNGNSGIPAPLVVTLDEEVVLVVSELVEELLD